MNKKEMEDIMSDLQVEMILLEEAYGDYFPEPSIQLDRFNILSEEYWNLYKKIEKLEDEQ